MFDVEKARAAGLDERAISVLAGIRENRKREKSCDGHEFEKCRDDRPGRYTCKKCGCSENIEWVMGYNRGIEHGKAENEKYKLALFAVIRNSKVAPAGVLLGKSNDEINEMTKATMEEIFKKLNFEKIRSWYDGGEKKDVQQMPEMRKETDGSGEH